MNDRVRKLLESFQHAFTGLWDALRTQRNARIHLSVAFLVVLLGLALELDSQRWAIIALTMGFVFASELFNTVIEAAIDLLTEEYHPLAKRAKDIAAGAVLVSAIVAVVVGLLVLGPPLVEQLGW
jgi:diacylglycerol kinase